MNILKLIYIRNAFVSSKQTTKKPIDKPTVDLKCNQKQQQQQQHIKDSNLGRLSECDLQVFGGYSFFVLLA